MVAAREGGHHTALDRGQRLTVIDPRGEQVADLVAYNRHDIGEVISSGRTLDYASRIYLTTGDPLYSNRSNVLLRIVAAGGAKYTEWVNACRTADARSSGCALFST